MFAVKNPFERSLAFAVEMDAVIDPASDSMPAIQRSIKSVVTAPDMVAVIRRTELNLGIEDVVRKFICPMTGRKISRSMLDETDTPVPIDTVKFLI